MLKSTDEDLQRSRRALEYWSEPFDLVDSALEHALEIAKLDTVELQFERSLPAAAKTIYLIYWKFLDAGNPHYGDHKYLGRCELRKMPNDVTEVVIERIITGERAIPFEKLVLNWRAYVQYDKDVAEAVRARAGAKAGGVTTPRRPPGRPKLEDDMWAWEEVNVAGRPSADVFEAWLERDGVKSRNLQDPRRHFRRIIKPGWGTKPGQKV